MFPIGVWSQPPKLFAMPLIGETVLVISKRLRSMRWNR